MFEIRLKNKILSHIARVDLFDAWFEENKYKYGSHLPPDLIRIYSVDKRVLDRFMVRDIANLFKYLEDITRFDISVVNDSIITYITTKFNGTWSLHFYYDEVPTMVGHIKENQISLGKLVLVKINPWYQRNTIEYTSKYLFNGKNNYIGILQTIKKR